MFIQSAYAMPDAEKKVQEERPLVSINDSFKKIIILNGDIVPRHQENGVTILGLKDFLLNKDALEL